MTVTLIALAVMPVSLAVRVLPLQASARLPEFVVFGPPRPPLDPPLLPQAAMAIEHAIASASHDARFTVPPRRTPPAFRMVSQRI